MRSLALRSILCAAPIALLLALWSGAVQDYGDYVRHWLGLMGGERRHITSYGPLFDALAPLAMVHPLAPKLLFVGVWLGSSAWLVRLALRLHPQRPRLALGVAAFLLNPWFWSEVAVYAHFDVLAAAFCLAAVHLATEQRRWQAGLALACGVLLKFIPLALLPVLLLDADARRVRLSPLLALAALCAAGMGLGYALAGDAVLEPFRIGAQRLSTGFSPFDYLAGPHSILPFFTDRPDLDDWSTPAVAIAWAITLLLVLAYRIDAATAALLLSLAVLTLYRSGHSQFQMIPALLAPYWYIRQGYIRRALDRRAGGASHAWASAALALYFSWLLLETLAWVLDAPPVFFSLDGLVHLLVSTNLYAALLRDAMRRRPGASLRYGLAW